MCRRSSSVLPIATSMAMVSMLRVLISRPGRDQTSPQASRAMILKKSSLNLVRFCAVRCACPVPSTERRTFWARSSMSSMAAPVRLSATLVHADAAERQSATPRCASAVISSPMRLPRRDGTPLLDLGLHEVGEFCRRHVFGFDRFRGEPRLYSGQLQHRPDVPIEPLHDIRRQTGRSGDRPPGRRRQLVIAEVLEGRHVREVGLPPARRDRQRKEHGRPAPAHASLVQVIEPSRT